MTENQEKFETLPAEIPADVTKPVSLKNGIIPSDFEELNRFAALVHRAHLSPNSFDTPEKIAIGILTNMELGRPIITGLQDLAIINGKCGIYGDASLAMVTASGLMDDDYPHEEETGTPFQDDWTFIFKVKRKGKSERIGKWTWAESKDAGFDNPQLRSGGKDIYSPWRRFTRRMMQWKARNYVLRDVFGDVLKGMKTVEDLHDMDGVIDMTSSGRGSYEVEESTKDLADKILNGKDETPKKGYNTSIARAADRSAKNNGKHGAGMSEEDRDMGKAQDLTKHEHIHPNDERWDPKKYICVCGFATGDRLKFDQHLNHLRLKIEIKTPPPPEKTTPAFTTELHPDAGLENAGLQTGEPDTPTDAQEDAEEDKRALATMSKALFDKGIVLPNKNRLLDFLRATGKDYDFPLIEVVEMAQKNLEGFVKAYGKWELANREKSETETSKTIVKVGSETMDIDGQMRESKIYKNYDPTKEGIQKRYNAEKVLKIRDTIKELEIEASPNFLNGATGAVLHEFLLNNLKVDEPDPLPDQEPPETHQEEIDYDLTQTDEWQELTLLSEQHIAEYKAVMAGRPINTVEDLKAAISEIDKLVDSQSSPFGAGIPDGK